MTWLIMRSSLDKIGSKTVGFREWMRLKSKFRITERKNLRKGLERDHFIYKK